MMTLTPEAFMHRLHVSSFRGIKQASVLPGRLQHPLCKPPNSNFLKNPARNMSGDGKKSDSEWRAVLSPEQFRILREKGTEMPHTGKYDKHAEEGVYECAGCGTPLYKSTTKFSSGCGWPAFFDGMCSVCLVSP